jgi:OmpA-OmpF porin, OOP family
MRRVFSIAAILAVVAVPCIQSVVAQSNVKDHPLVSRFQGSDVLSYKSSDFDEFVMALGPITAADAYTKSQRLEGKVTKFKYSQVPGRSGLEVIRSYQTALEQGGFQVLFKCDGPACISDKFNKGYTESASGIWCVNCEEPMRYVAAKLTRPMGDVYVSVVVEKDKYEGGTWLSIIEVKPIESGLVVVKAEAMKTDIASAGHTPIYGVYFDTGKAVLKPESDATLAEIARLLKADSAMKIHVVGHTDNVGTSAANMDLSKQRAAAVVSALVTKYQIAAARLDSAGVGPFSPVATNRTEQGRAKNRRVELVEQ